MKPESFALHKVHRLASTLEFEVQWAETVQQMRIELLCDTTSPRWYRARLFRFVTVELPTEAEEADTWSTMEDCSEWLDIRDRRFEADSLAEAENRLLAAVERRASEVAWMAKDRP